MKTTGVSGIPKFGLLFFFNTLMTKINLSASLLRRAVAWVLFSHSGSQFLHQSSRPDLRSEDRPSLSDPVYN